MLHGGHGLAGVGMLFVAKLVGLGAIAFVFDITRPKLMQLAWFARLYALMMRGLDWAHAMVDPITRRIGQYTPMVRPRNAGRFYRVLSPSHAGALAHAASGGRGVRWLLSQ